MMRPTPPLPLSPGDPVLVEIGERSFRGVVVSAESDPARREAVVSTDAKAVLEANPDFSKAARVSRVSGEPQILEFGIAGSVMTFGPHGPDTWHLRVLELGIFGNMTVGGLGFRGVTNEEYLWVIGRDAGFPPGRLNFPTFRPPKERFLVVIPVEGVELNADLEAGDVILTPNATVAKAFFGLGPTDLQADFIATGVWAAAEIDSARMWDAEQIAIRRFNRALGRLTLAARFPLAVGADGTLRPFDASTRAEQPRLRTIAGVSGRRTGRIWLRGYRNTPNRVPITHRVLAGLVNAISLPDERIDEAIAAWLRAGNEEDSTAAAVALSEALEFYAAGSHAPQLFTKTEIGQMKKAAKEAVGLGRMESGPRRTPGLQGAAPVSAEDRARRERLDQRLGDVNTPPAAALLRAALDADGVECSDKDFDLIGRIREVRRLALHGQARVALDATDLRDGLSLVNRLLVARLRGLAVKREER